MIVRRSDFVNRLSGLKVPHNHEPIRGRRHDQMIVLSGKHIRHISRVARILTQFLPRSDPVQPDFLGGRKQPWEPIIVKSREFQTRDRALVRPHNFLQAAPGLQLPDLDFSGLAARGENLVVGGDCQCVHGVLMAHVGAVVLKGQVGPEGLDLRVPDFDDPVGSTEYQKLAIVRVDRGLSHGFLAEGHLFLQKLDDSVLIFGFFLFVLLFSENVVIPLFLDHSLLSLEAHRLAWG